MLETLQHMNFIITNQKNVVMHLQQKKPMSTRGWECMISTDTILAGYPHIHYMGNPQVAEAFAGACRRYKEKD